MPVPSGSAEAIAEASYSGACARCGARVAGGADISNRPQSVPRSPASPEALAVCCPLQRLRSRSLRLADRSCRVLRLMVFCQAFRPCVRCSGRRSVRTFMSPALHGWPWSPAGGLKAVPVAGFSLQKRQFSTIGRGTKGVVLFFKSSSRAVASRKPAVFLGKRACRGSQAVRVGAFRW